ncbi:MAG: hypothetical protein ACREQY_04800 [Candidatus Binatia bacterium]
MNGRTGFTAVEVLVATAATLLLLASVGTAAAFQRRLLARETASLERREACARVLGMIAREVRGAGFDPVADGTFDGALDGIAVARQALLEIRSDHHGAQPGTAPDGEVDLGSDERIAFFRSPSSRSVALSLGSQTQSLTWDVVVPAGGLAFRYFDGCGRELVPEEPAGLSAEDRRRIRRVTISIEVSAAGGTDSLAGEASAFLRNRAAECGG